MRKTGFIAILGFIIIVSLSGCVQSSCCGYPTYYFVCTKDSMTIPVQITGNASVVQSMINDSISKYQANGYACGPTVTGSPYSITCVRGKQNIKRVLEAGEVCVPYDDNGYCEDGAQTSDCYGGI